MLGATLLLHAALPIAAQTNVAGTNLSPATIPFEFTRGHIMVAARVNGSPPLSFMLDTGYSLTMLNPEHVEPLNLKPVGKVTIVGIVGEEDANLFAGATFDLTGATYAPRRIASLPSDRGKRKRDGILGSGFFKRFVVEIDPRAKTIQLHEPKSFAYSGPGEILALQFRKDTPIVEALINVPGRPAIRGLFEVDSGCDDGLCCGHDFVVEHRLDEFAGPTQGGARQGVGGGTRIQHGHLPQLQLGRLTIKKPSANFFQLGSPADRGLAGHIGIEVLRQFKVIFDYSRQRLILEPFPAAK